MSDVGERPFGVRDDELSYVISSAKDYAFFKGIAMRTTQLSADARVPLPFCLFPSSFPRKWFLHVKDIQKSMNYLLHQVANNPEFLRCCLSTTAEFDEFTRNLLNIYETVLEEGVAQPVSLGILRSDYMVNAYDGEIKGIKLIENNTFASSLGGIAPKVKELHSYILEKIGVENYHSKLPENNSTDDIATAISYAWNYYNNVYEQEKTIVLFVVENLSFNICDQRALEFALKKNIQAVRCSFDDLQKSATMKEQRLFIDDKEVAVVYFRYGFSPDHYTKEHWDMRLLIERSRAIKCPSISYHLAGTKKVQVHLSQPGILEQFFEDKETIEKIRCVFAEHYALDMNEAGDKAVSLALQNPDCYVLKPEREGGGNNLFGEEMKQTLQSIASSNARQAFTLMERINPPMVPNYIIQRDVIPKLTPVMSELGIFGIILGSKETIYVNSEAGHLLRSKRSGLNEGGIAAGFGAIDSPYLI